MLSRRRLVVGVWQAACTCEIRVSVSFVWEDEMATTALHTASRLRSQTFGKEGKRWLESGTGIIVPR